MNTELNTGAMKLAAKRNPITKWLEKAIRDTDTGTLELAVLRLEEARELILDPKHWTKHVSARDVHGVPVSSFDTNAVCFCSVGALDRVSANSDFPYRTMENILLSATMDHSYHSVPAFNDNNPHDVVLALWDHTVAAVHAELENRK